MSASPASSATSSPEARSAPWWTWTVRPGVNRCGLGRPVAEHGRRGDDQRRALVLVLQQVGEDGRGLAEAHVHGQAAAEAGPVEEREPAPGLGLVVAQLAVEPSGAGSGRAAPAAAPWTRSTAQPPPSTSTGPPVPPSRPTAWRRMAAPDISVVLDRSARASAAASRSALSSSTQPPLVCTSGRACRASLRMAAASSATSSTATDHCTRDSCWAPTTDSPPKASAWSWRRGVDRFLASSGHPHGEAGGLQDGAARGHQLPGLGAVDDDLAPALAGPAQRRQQPLEAAQLGLHRRRPGGAAAVEHLLDRLGRPPAVGAGLVRLDGEEPAAVVLRRGQPHRQAGGPVAGHRRGPAGHVVGHLRRRPGGGLERLAGQAGEDGLGHLGTRAGHRHGGRRDQPGGAGPADGVGGGAEHRPAHPVGLPGLLEGRHGARHLRDALLEAIGFEDGRHPADLVLRRCWPARPCRRRCRRGWRRRGSARPAPGPPARWPTPPPGPATAGWGRRRRPAARRPRRRASRGRRRPGPTPPALSRRTGGGCRRGAPRRSTRRRPRSSAGRAPRPPPSGRRRCRPTARCGRSATTPAAAGGVGGASGAAARPSSDGRFSALARVLGVGVEIGGEAVQGAAQRVPLAGQVVEDHGALGPADVVGAAERRFGLGQEAPERVEPLRRVGAEGLHLCGRGTASRLRGGQRLEVDVQFRSPVCSEPDLAWPLRRARYLGDGYRPQEGQPTTTA